MNLPFFIAKRYLISKKSHNAINIISAISVAGVCIGTMALIIVLSAFNGLSDLVTSLYNSFDADIEVSIKKGKVFNVDANEIKLLKKMNGVAFYSEIMSGNAMLKFNDKQCVATIKGVSSNYEKINGIDTLVRDGFFSVEKTNIVMGKGIAYKLDHGSDNTYTPISVYAPKRGEVSTFDSEAGLNELKTYASGTFSINDEFDGKYVFMNIENARKLFDYTNEVTSIELKVKKGFSIEHVQQEIKSILGDKYEVKNKEQQNALLYKTMKSEKLWTFLILVFILIIGTFNVIASITMLILEKKKDITILYNMGATTLLIRKVFLIEGILITLIGAIAGVILGTLICWLQMKFSLVTFSEGYIVDAYPVKMKLSDFFIILTTVLLIGVFAAWYPVRIFTKRQLLA